MEDHQHKAENTFTGDEASTIVKECVDVILGGVDYDESRINEWMSAVVEQSLTHLVKMEKAFKYIGSCTVRWENRTMYCIVNVFAVAIHL
ncbi:dynein light chain Tctex-type 3 isoform X2 [Rhinoderma darwinii]|uniref:dynein light chain Tctex-type 3 isoform X2 n=1 Tax=Rhinoderma darwinii TaxID=43563 RepID=UPI003F673C83